uniref:Acetylcholinesterase n=1 Tax=Strongyloides venezuelensis TaxID=75913 RepID=A0A0K0FZS2_STRVS
MGVCYGQSPVNTSYGSIIGKKHNIFSDVTEYLGIPFAKPPVGKLRFKVPVELDKPAWNGTFNASILANTCYYVNNNQFLVGYPGYDFWHPNYLNYSEDCLQLNMWVPKNSTGSVLVFLFGRGYQTGSPSLNVYDGSFLALKTGAIIVNLNYRLDVLGFAFMVNSSNLPGNVGLLDQQMGLKWIHENINYFGGNPKNVTLFGEDVGAFSGTAHLFSDGSHNYFSKLIVNSGSVLNTWFRESNKIANDNLLALARSLNCSGNDNETFICLQSQDAVKLITEASKIKHNDQSPLISPFIFVEEDDNFFKGNLSTKIFMNDMMKDIDVMIGITSDEGSYFMVQYFNDETFGCNFKKNKSYDSEDNVCPMTEEEFENVLKFVTIYDKNYVEDFLDLNDTYNGIDLKEPRYKALKFLSDYLFNCDISLFAYMIGLQAKGKKYFYEFQKKSKINHWPEWMGSMHSYELLYQFGYPFTHPESYSNDVLKEEQDFSMKMINIISNFIHTGVPSLKWEEFNETTIKTVILDDSYNDECPIKYSNPYSQGCYTIDSIKYRYQELNDWEI